MNYKMFGEWVEHSTDELVRLGIPRKEAERIMQAAELDAFNISLKERNEAQFLLDFRRLGTTVLAERHGVTRQAIRKRWEKIQKSKAPVVTAVCMEG